MPRPKRRLSANQEQSHHLSLTSTSSSSPSHLFTSLRPMDPQTHHHSPTAAAGQLPYPSSSSSDHSHSGPSGLIGRQIVNHREILDDVETNQSQSVSFLTFCLIRALIVLSFPSGHRLEVPAHPTVIQLHHHHTHPCPPTPHTSLHKLPTPIGLICIPTIHSAPSLLGPLKLPHLRDHLLEMRIFSLH